MTSPPSRLTILAAPSNLGLRPPGAGREPGTAGAPEALRRAGLQERLGAQDGGTVVPARYIDDDATRPRGRVRNQDGLIAFSRALAARLRDLLTEGRVPLVVGGDCSVLLGAGLALTGGRAAGLVHIDGHTDFRHPGDGDEVASVAGEDLAAAVGMHLPAIADIDGAGPYFDRARVAHVGCRDGDEHLAEVRDVIALAVPASSARTTGMARTAQALAAVAGPRFWLQVDVDVLDPSRMPAVDSPDPGGLLPEELAELLRALAPQVIGASVTVFDPELDPDGRHAALLVDVLTAGLSDLGSAPPQD